MEYSVLTAFKDIDIKDLKIKSHDLYPSCSSYLKDIILFDSNNYIEYLGNSSRYNIFFNFMENYKDIENEELKIKVTHHDKNELLFKNIHFLFDRLDNAINVLNDKTNNHQENPDYIKELVFLETTLELCIKTEEKYKNYLNNDVCPLFNNKKYIKDSVIQLYNMKNIEMIKINTNIINKINTLKDKIKKSDDYAIHYLICCIAFFIAFVYYYFKY